MIEIKFLYRVELGCLFAPAMYYNGNMTRGPAVELNIVSDFTLELSLAQLNLMTRLVAEIKYILSFSWVYIQWKFSKSVNHFKNKMLDYCLFSLLLYSAQKFQNHINIVELLTVSKRERPCVRSHVQHRALNLYLKNILTRNLKVSNNKIIKEQKAINT